MNIYQSIFRSDMGRGLSFLPGYNPAGLTNRPLLKVLCHV